jgi:hypothetical protein
MNGKVSVAFLAFDCTILCLCLTQSRLRHENEAYLRERGSR